MGDSFGQAVTVILSQGGVPALVVVITVVGVFVVAYKKAGREAQNPPPEHPIEVVTRRLSEEIRDQGAATRAQIARVEARADHAHSRLDAILIALGRREQ